MSPWIARRWYDSVFWTTFAGFTLGHSLRVIGRRNMPETGPVLLIANHQSYLDPVLVGLASRRYLSFLARESLFRNSFFSSLIESLDAIPINNQVFAKEGLERTFDVLQRGKCVLIFPEGERTFDGAMRAFKPGIWLIAKRMKVTILPVGIAGAFEAWPRMEKVPRLSPLFLPPLPPTISVSIGEPIPYDDIADLRREECMKFLYDKVAREFDKAKQIKRQNRG